MTDMAMANLSIAPTAISPRAAPILMSRPPGNARKCKGAVADSQDPVGQTPSGAGVAGPARPHDGGVRTVADAGVAISGFVDHHPHLLTEAAGTPFPWQGTTVRAFHERVRREGTTPMDVPETPSGGSLKERAAPVPGPGPRRRAWPGRGH